MRKSTLSLLIVFFTLLFSGCSHKDESSITVATNTWPGYEPLYLAREKGFFPAERIKLKRLGSASEVMQQFRNGKIDIAALTLDEALLLKDQNFDLKVILVMDISNGADVLIAKEGISGLKELKGKRIGYENTALGALMLERALEKGGLKNSDIIPFPVTYADHEHFFLNDQVDAVITFEPVRTRLLSEGGVQIFDSSMIPGEIIDVLVAKESFINKHQAKVREMIRGWYQAVELMKESPEESAAVMARFEGVTPEAFQASLSGLTIGCKDTNKKFLSGASPAILKSIDYLHHLMRQNAFVSSEDLQAKDLLYSAQESLF